ncbi:MAG: pyrroloquinoline quinone biosynthesis protein B [Arenicella sp.]
MVLIKFVTFLFLSISWLGVAHAGKLEAPYLYVLGVAQDAGYPQAGCYKPHCLPAWNEFALRRGATSLGLVDPQANRKYLFEATPNLPSQLFALEQ